MGRGSKPAELIGTQSADRIRASGHARRVEQAGHMSAPDRADLSERNPLRGGGRPHMSPYYTSHSGMWVYVPLLGGNVLSDYFSLFAIRGILRVARRHLIASLLIAPVA